MIDTGRRMLAAALAGAPSSCSGANRIISFGVKTHDNRIFPYLNEIVRFQPKVIFFLKNSIFLKETNF
jgi:hypothetical protein